MPMRFRGLGKTAILPAVMTAMLTAAAQAAVIEEVVVTAQKREQTLQDVPVAVSVYSGEFMERFQVRDLRDLVVVTPGFSGRTEDSFQDALSVRGISTNDFGMGGDPSVGIFTDGFYEGRTGGAVTSMLDMERAEVVKGPQGTLFGRNAIAGAISMTTRKPVGEFEGRISGTVEEYDHFEGTATVNVPLNDQFWFRGTIHHMQNDGFLKNLAGGDDLGGHNRDAFQGALRYAGERLDVTVSALYEDRKGSPSVYWAPADGLPKNRVITDLGDDGRDESEIIRVIANLEYELPNGYSITGIGGYKTYDFFYLEDYDAGPLTVDHYLQDQQVDYWSGELRLNSPADGRVVWFVGASAYREKARGRFQNIYTEDHLCRAMVTTEVGDVLSAEDFTWPEGTTVTGCDDPVFEAVWDDDIDPADLLENKAETNFNRGVYTGWAVYADLTWSVTDRLDLIFGARYTYDEKKFRVRIPDSGGALGNNFAFEFFTDGWVSDKDDWSDFTPRAAINFRLTEDVALYANVAKGFKSGGYATFGLDLPDDPDDDGLVPPGTLPKQFDPEEVLSFEGGIKGRWLDGRLAANLSGYYFEYSDLQLVFFSGGSSLVDNVAEASGIGAELELRFVPTERWDILFTAAYLDTTIDKVDPDFLDEGGCDACKGNSLWFAPEWTTATIVTYRHPFMGGELFLTGEHFFEDRKYAGPDNLALSTTDSWNQVNLRLGYDSGKAWSAVLYVNNVFDEVYFERGWENADADDLFGYGLRNTLVWPSKPRTVGFRIDYRF
jgi:iron complex outermembrane receptor protein